MATVLVWTVDFHSFYTQIIFYCICVSHLVYSFIWWQKYFFDSSFDYCEQCCDITRCRLAVWTSNPINGIYRNAMNTLYQSDTCTTICVSCLCSHFTAQNARFLNSWVPFSFGFSSSNPGPKLPSFYLGFKSSEASPLSWSAAWEHSTGDAICRGRMHEEPRVCGELWTQPERHAAAPLTPQYTLLISLL